MRLHVVLFSVHQGLCLHAIARALIQTVPLCHLQVLDHATCKLQCATQQNVTEPRCWHAHVEVLVTCALAYLLWWARR